MVTWTSKTLKYPPPPKRSIYFFFFGELTKALNTRVNLNYIEKQIVCTVQKELFVITKKGPNG